MTKNNNTHINRHRAQGWSVGNNWKGNTGNGFSSKAPLPQPNSGMPAFSTPSHNVTGKMKAFANENWAMEPKNSTVKQEECDWSGLKTEAAPAAPAEPTRGDDVAQGDRAVLETDCTCGQVWNGPYCDYCLDRWVALGNREEDYQCTCDHGGWGLDCDYCQDRLVKGRGRSEIEEAAKRMMNEASSEAKNKIIDDYNTWMDDEYHANADWKKTEVLLAHFKQQVIGQQSREKRGQWNADRVANGGGGRGAAESQCGDPECYECGGGFQCMYDLGDGSNEKCSHWRHGYYLCCHDETWCEVCAHDDEFISRECEGGDSCGIWNHAPKPAEFQCCHGATHCHECGHYYTDRLIGEDLSGLGEAMSGIDLGNDHAEKAPSRLSQIPINADDGVDHQERPNAGPSHFPEEVEDKCESYKKHLYTGPYSDTSEGRYSDVTVYCEGSWGVWEANDIFKLHYSILCPKSPYFAKIFEQPELYQDKKIYLETIVYPNSQTERSLCAEDFARFIQLVYLNELDVDILRAEGSPPPQDLIKLHSICAVLGNENIQKLSLKIAKEGLEELFGRLKDDVRAGAEDMFDLKKVVEQIKIFEKESGFDELKDCLIRHTAQSWVHLPSYHEQLRQLLLVMPEFAIQVLLQMKRDQADW